MWFAAGTGRWLNAWSYTTCIWPLLPFACSLNTTRSGSPSMTALPSENLAVVSVYFSLFLVFLSKNDRSSLRKLSCGECFFLSVFFLSLSITSQPSENLAVMSIFLSLFLSPSITCLPSKLKPFFLVYFLSTKCKCMFPYING